MSYRCPIHVGIPLQEVKRPYRTSSSARDAVSPRITAAKAAELAYVVAISSTARIADEIDPIAPRLAHWPDLS